LDADEGRIAALEIYSCRAALSWENTMK
jgi:hypothetical protein